MTTEHYDIICNTCKVPPEPIAESNPETWGCPVCGVNDSPENIIGEAKEHAVEVAARKLQDMTGEIAKGSRFIKVTHKHIPHRVYRFVTDFKL